MINEETQQRIGSLRLHATVPLFLRKYRIQFEDRASRRAQRRQAHRGPIRGTIVWICAMALPLGA
jgi:hypothetical protein